MDHTRLIKISKFLSYHLRHHPEKLGLTVETGGWVSVDALLKSANLAKFPLTRFELESVVKNNDKQRFSFDLEQKRIRANQGHSIAVDLQFILKILPDILYHGTHAVAVSAILEQGLHKRSRHHVHLSSTLEIAKAVGKRRGTPVILEINAKAMADAGYQFYCSDNGVWLVDNVPVAYLRLLVGD